MDYIEHVTLNVPAGDFWMDQALVKTKSKTTKIALHVDRRVFEAYSRIYCKSVLIIK